MSVQDDGAGIAPEDRERVFEAFVRLREGQLLDPGGSGLGLPIVKAIAEASGGGVGVVSSGGLTSFELRLPLLAT